MAGSLGGRNDLRDYIRFQLSQLLTQNAAHTFERLAFDLARSRIASNLLPATGPVQAGGDQGRDFESFHTYLAKSPLATSSFVALASENIIVGAVTLNKQITTKIKADLKPIFGTGTEPDQILYFCE
jgi:hypothetical protein